MRVSVLRDDPCFDLDAAGRYDVMLNGVLVRACLTADEEIGMVTYCQLDQEGYLVHDQGEVVVRRDCGAVVLVPRIAAGAETGTGS